MSRDLNRDPDDILDWYESKFYLWLAVSQDVSKEELMLRSILTSYAVWKPGEISNILEDKEPMTEDDVQEALSKAEKIMQMKFKETT